MDARLLRRWFYTQVLPPPGWQRKFYGVPANKRGSYGARAVPGRRALLNWRLYQSRKRRAPLWQCGDVITTMDALVQELCTKPVVYWHHHRYPSAFLRNFNLHYAMQQLHAGQFRRAVRRWQPPVALLT